MSNVLKKSLQTTIFTTVLSAAITTPLSAYTINSDVMELNAVTPWSVSRAGAGAQAYCTLSKTFKKDIILTLAENTDQNLTFAIDFQKERFESQSIYNIILATDNGDSRSYEISPTTGTAFIIRVKDDAEFYDNLWESDSLLVSVNTENYRFSTADFLTGKKDISSCINVLEDMKPKPQVKQKVAAAQQPTITEVPVQSVTKIETKAAANIVQPQIEALPQPMAAPRTEAVSFAAQGLSEISKIAGEVEKLKEENRNLKQALKTERVSFETRMNAVNANNSPASQELTQKISYLNNENKQLKDQIRSQLQNASITANSMTQKLSAEIQKLRTENNLLQTTLEATKQSQKEQALKVVSANDYDILQQQNNALSAQIQVLTAENLELKSLADHVTKNGGAQDKLVQNLTSENIRLKSEIKIKDARINALEASLKTAETNLNGLQPMKVKISQLEIENETIAKSYAALEAAAGEVTPSNADMELQAIQQRYAEKERELKRTIEEMERQKQAAILEQKRLETMLFDPAVTEQKQLARLNKLENELKLANQALAEQRQMQQTGVPVSNTTQKFLAKPVSEMTNSERITMMEMSNEIQKLRDEIDRLRRAPAPVPIEKAVISEKRMVIERGQSLETATPFHKFKEQVDAQQKEINDAQIAMAKAQAQVANNNSPEPEITSLKENTSSEPVTLQVEENDLAPEINVETAMPATNKLEPEMEPSNIETANYDDVITIEETLPAQNIPAPPMENRTTMISSNTKPGVLALPDPEMVKLLQKQDKTFTVKSQDRGTVHWASDMIEGTVIRKHLQGQTFETSVEDMIANLKQKCPAIMEVEPVLLRKGKSQNLYAYDADCGASTLGFIFFSKDGQTISTISYGSGKDQKATLDGKREKLIDALMGSMQS